MRLLRHAPQRRHVLHNRIGARKSERNILVLCDAATVEHHVTRELRIGAFEEPGHAHCERIDRTQIDGGVTLGDEF